MNNERIKRSYNLKTLYLDPNNYRFIDNKDYIKVSEEKILDTVIQARTRRFIEGKNQSNIKDLIDSFMANGFLDVDVIQVKDLGNNHHLVLEGNRRVTALKLLKERYDDKLNIGKLSPSIFGSIPFKIHNGNDISKHQVIMGLKHINGNKKWPTLNQAQLVYDIVKKYDSKSEGEEFAMSSLGITKAKVRRYIRVLELIKYYKDSDYGDNFTTDMYSIFEEVIKKPILKEWIGFDDYSYKVSNKINLEKLFSWISSSEETEYNEDSNEYDIINTLEPIITKSLEIRTLSEFINDNNAIKKLEETRDISKALAISSYVGKNKFSEAIKSAKENIKNSILFKDYLDNSDIEDIERLHSDIQKLLPQKINLSLEKDKHISAIFTEGIKKHFSDIEIVDYKHFHNFKINGFKRVNIITGFNNSGKTSLLEAIYFLTIQNDISSFFDIIKLKNKFSNNLDPIWLNEILTKSINIKAIYNDIPTSILIENSSTQDDIDKVNYVSTIKISSTVGDERNSSKIHLYSTKEPQLHYKNIRYLSFSMFKSPYFYSHSDLLNSYADGVEKKLDTIIIKFIQKIDKDIIDIKQIEKNGIKRFLVILNNQDELRDITSFGEGLQRVFEISLAFASCKNGILLIDELETAIHKSLLIDFTAFIQELSDKFNVQVFITSHSKECIDAFVKNSYSDNSKLMAYQLENNNEIFSYKYIDGDRLETLVDSMDLDIRGDRDE